MKKIGKEFKDFIMRGNVVDLAVGVVIGGAFGAITTSLVNDIIMPFISLITGGTDFTQWKWILKAGELNDAGELVGQVSVNYGNLISVILNFLIIALVLFFVVKGINKMKKPPEEPAPAEPAGPTAEELLGEIRDLLKENK